MFQVVLYITLQQIKLVSVNEANNQSIQEIQNDIGAYTHDICQIKIVSFRCRVF